MLLALALLLAESCTPAPVETPTATPPPPIEQPVVVTGSGMTQTRPFVLAGGNYTIDWTAQDKNPRTPCFHSGALRGVDNSTTQSLGLKSVDAGQSASGETTAYHLIPGQYYLSMTSGCDWSVTISPLT